MMAASSCHWQDRDRSVRACSAVADVERPFRAVELRPRFEQVEHYTARCRADNVSPRRFRKLTKNLKTTPCKVRDLSEPT